MLNSKTSIYAKFEQDEIIHYFPGCKLTRYIFIQSFFHLAIHPYNTVNLSIRFHSKHWEYGSKEDG